MTALASPATMERRVDRPYSSLLYARIGPRRALSGGVAVVYVAVLILGIVLFLAPPRISLTLRAAPHGGPRIAWILPGGNLWVAGLRPGDQVLRLDGREPYSAGSGAWEGTSIVARVDGGRALAIDAGSVAHTSSTWPLLVLSPWFFLLGMLVYLRAVPRSLARSAFALYALAAFALALGPVADSNSLILGAMAERVAVPLFAASFAGFFLVFPRAVCLQLQTWVLFWLPACLCGALNCYGSLVPDAYQAADAILLALVVLYLSLGAVLVVRSFLLEREPAARTGLKIMAAGTVLSVLPFVTLSIGPSVLGLASPLRPEHAILGLAVLPLSFTYAILRYEVVAVHLIQRWLAHLVIWGGLIGVYASTAIIGCRLLGVEEVGHTAQLIGAILLSVLVSVSFPPSLRWVRQALDRRVFHDSYDYRSSLQEISQGLSFGAGLDTLGRSLPATLAGMMHLQSVSLLASDGERPRCLGSAGTVSPEIERMVQSHCREVPAVPEPFLLGAGPGASLLVPLYAEGTMAGFLCLGPKRNGEPFSSEDLALLRTLSGHLAAALRSAQLAQELRAKVAMLDALNARVERAQEEERARLVAELHDEPLQTALHLQRSIAAEGTGRAATEQHLLLSERIVLQLRSLCMEVRPAALDELGIAAALELLTTDLEQHAGVPILLHADSDIDDLRLPAHAELALYRAAQEALNNALKHARPSTLRVCLEHRECSVLLIVEDDGTGFDVQESSRSLLAAGHLGLAGLRQRIERVGGSLEVTSRPGAGTCVRIRLPVEEGAT